MTQENWIDGLVVTPLKVIDDDRGAVLHYLKRDVLGQNGFGEAYFSETKPGVVKAWKRHENLIQHFAVPIGQIHLVIYDDRVGSPTRGKTNEISFGREENYWCVRIPADVWYGFKAISSGPAIIANVINLTHAEAKSHSLEISNPTIPYQWAQ